MLIPKQLLNQFTCQTQTPLHLLSRFSGMFTKDIKK
jgi:hypothetical protein